MTTYTIKSGDTLGKIARQFYNDASKYMLIAKANNIVDVNKISVGMTLEIPELAPQPTAEVTPTSLSLTATELKAIMPRASDEAIDKYLNGINQALQTYAINTPLRACHFLAQIAHESGELRYNEENLNYSAKALQAVFGKYFPTQAAADACARKPEAIANIVYADRMGNGDPQSDDGWRYRGRGLFQLTGKDNYQRYSDYCQSDVVSQPDEVAHNPVHCVGVAGWYWQSHNLNALADNDDIKAITRKINGGLNGLDDREAKLAQAKAVLMG